LKGIDVPNYRSNGKADVPESCYICDSYRTGMNGLAMCASNEVLNNANMRDATKANDDVLYTELSLEILYLFFRQTTLANILQNRSLR